MPDGGTQLRALSLGAGVQSTVMVLMAARGEIEPLADCAIFADTQWEPRDVYEHLGWLEGEITRLTNGRLPVYRVSRGNLREQCLRNARHELKNEKRSTVPAFAIGKDGKASPLSRHCTRDYKIDPIRTKLRELLGFSKGERLPKDTKVEQWIGISTDEASRMKPSQDWWCVNRWPLIEAGMSRGDCIQWWRRNYPDRPPLVKSSCIGCPYHSDATWREMKRNDPESWADAVDFDEQIRNGFIGNRSEHIYLHRSLKPLAEVDLRNAEDRGQINMFVNECEGMCGV